MSLSDRIEDKLQAFVRRLPRFIQPFAGTILGNLAGAVIVIAVYLIFFH